MKQKIAEQDLISLKSGIWGHNIDLKGLVQEGWISQAGADLYLEDIGSKSRVVLNDNNLSDVVAEARV